MDNGQPLSPRGAQADTLQIVLDFEAVRDRLDEFDLDMTTRRTLTDFARIAEAGGLADALREDWRALDPCAENADQRPAHDRVADAFGRHFADFTEWDFTPGWLNGLIARWLDLLTAGAHADRLDALASRALARSIALLSDPVRGAGVKQVAMIDAVGKLLFFVASVLADATASHAESQYLRAEEYDEGSGLPNLHRALAATGAAIANAKDGEFVAMIVVRVEIGPLLLRMPPALSQRLLRQLVGRVRGVLRSRDGLFIGAEWELIAVLPALASTAHVTLALTHLLQLFDEAFHVAGREYRLTPVAGAALFPDAARERDALLQAARLALHEARRGGERYALFRAEMDRSAARHAAVEQDFLLALRDDRLELHLQPQVETRTGYCHHAEALLRWSPPGGDPVPPQLVIEIAEEAGAGEQFTRWLVTRAARALAEFTQCGISLSLSINITANDLRDEDLPNMVEQVFAIWKVPPDRLTLELTESAMLADEQHSLAILNRLRALGCHLAVDDFGTGYSSMAYLRQLPLNELKIDQIFVRRIDQSPQDREIVRSMIQLAQSLGLEVVAEGVESEATSRLLESYGCQRLQGYYFSRPIPLSEFPAWWEAHNRKLALNPPTPGHS